MLEREFSELARVGRDAPPAPSADEIVAELVSLAATEAEAVELAAITRRGKSKFAGMPVEAIPGALARGWRPDYLKGGEA